MRRLAAVALLAIAMLVGARRARHRRNRPRRSHRHIRDRAAGHHAGSPVSSWARSRCAAVSPMIGTVIARPRIDDRRGLATSKWSCFLGPVGWWLADPLVPPGSDRPPRPHGRRRRQRARGRQHQYAARRRGRFCVRTRCWSNSAPAPRRNSRAFVASRLQLTQLEAAELHAHGPHDRTLAHRRRPAGARDAAAMRAFAGVSAGQANIFSPARKRRPPRAGRQPRRRNTSSPSCIFWKRIKSPMATTCWWR